MIYLASWSFIYLSGMLKHVAKYRGWFFHLMTLLWFSFLVIFRGDVGTDTWMYEHMLNQSGSIFSGLEIGYELFTQTLKLLTADSQIVLRLVGLTFSLLFFYAYWVSSESGKFYIFYLLLPSAFFVFGMNIVRVGIASMLFFIFTHKYVNGRYIQAAIFGLASISFHYSIFVAFVFFWAIFYGNFSFRNIIYLTLSIAAGYFLLSDYFSGKLDMYEFSERPDNISGARSFFSLMLLVLATALSDLNRVDKIKIIANVLIFGFLFLIILFQSYAGLRLLGVLEFAAALVIVAMHEKYKLKLNKFVKVIYFFMGLIGIFGVYRNFLQENPGPSPFLPYNFIFIN